MKILALDTSSRASSCAIWEDGTLRGENFAHVDLTHSQTLMPMVEALLHCTRIPLEEMDLFAVSHGPGSFTGLRIGLSAVKGMALARNKPCVGVSTLEALAYNLLAFRGIVVPAMDARRQQVYTAIFRSDGKAITRLNEDAACSIEELREGLEPYAGESVLLLGDGAELCAEAFADLPNVGLTPPLLRHQRAGSIAQAAEQLAQAGEMVSASELSPVYLRLPQAERERLARLERE